MDVKMDIIDDIHEDAFKLQKYQWRVEESIKQGILTNNKDRIKVQSGTLIARTIGTELSYLYPGERINSYSMDTFATKERNWYDKF